MSRSLILKTKNAWGLGLTIVIILIIMSGNAVSAGKADLDYDSLVVTNGQTFVYEVTRFDVTDNFVSTIDFDFDYDGLPETTLRLGDQITMTIVDTTITSRDIFTEFGDYYDQNTIEISLSKGGSTVNTYSIVDEGDWVSLTDWPNLIEHFQESGQLAGDEAESLGVGASFKVEEMEELIYFKVSASASESGVSLKITAETFHDKATGVMQYNRAVAQVSGEGESVKIDFILSIVGFERPAESDDSLLPGFGMVLTSFTLLSTIVILKRKNRLI